MINTKVQLHYGKKFVNFELSANQISWIASPQILEHVSDISEETKKALTEPIGMPTLERVIGDKKLKTIILIDDFSRPTPTHLMLPVLIKKLNSSGIEDKNITILVALGTHRYMTDLEIEAKVGKDIVQRIKVINHRWQDQTELVYLGDSLSGIPIYINKHYHESDIRIALGNIVPHIYAGWSGGAKIIQPGISGPQTTAHTHLIAAKNLLGTVGTVENPMRHEMEDIAKKTGLTMIINTVMTPDGAVVKIVAGDPVKAHREGVKIAEKIFTTEILDRPDLVICSAYPADCDLWQSTKAMVVAAMCVRQGGVVILLTPSTEGDCPGHPDFVGLGSLEPEKIFHMVEKGLIEDIVAASVNMTVGVARKLSKIIVVTGEANKRHVEKLGLIYKKNLSEAIRFVKKNFFKMKTVGIITHGGEFAPKFYKVK